ncbi:MAG: hypothetical protein QG646_2393, partial [Euryarchaeota archaeon]|nr:hypothetical protein [Euryarchaeota archaeon]
MKRMNELDEIISTVSEAIFKVLNHYSCPADCHAYCCKKFPIEIDSKERKILRKRFKEKTDNLET